MNKVFLAGRITRDPEVRYTQSNIPSVNFSLAVERNYKDMNGQRQADFINCVAWRNHADFISRYIKKGYMLLVEGHIQTRSYQNQQGITQYITEVVVDEVQNMTPRQQGEANNTNYGYKDNRVEYNQPTYNQTTYEQPSYDINSGIVDDDDLPF